MKTKKKTSFCPRSTFLRSALHTLALYIGVIPAFAALPAGTEVIDGGIEIERGVQGFRSNGIVNGYQIPVSIEPSTSDRLTMDTQTAYRAGITTCIRQITLLIAGRAVTGCEGMASSVAIGPMQLFNVPVTILPTLEGPSRIGGGFLNSFSVGMSATRLRIAPLGATDARPLGDKAKSQIVAQQPVLANPASIQAVPGNAQTQAQPTRASYQQDTTAGATPANKAAPILGNPVLHMVWQAMGNLLRQPMFLVLMGIGLAVSIYRHIPKGKRGELAVVALKKAFLDKETYIDLNDVTLNTPSGTTQIDHVIISRYGIFVIETKNMTGWIFGSERQPEWTQSLPGGRKFRFQNPLHQNARHVRILEEFLDVPADTLHSIVVFIGDAEFKNPMPSNVMTGGFVSYIKARKAVVYSDAEVRSIVQTLKAGRMLPGAETHRAHLASLAERHAKRPDFTAS